MSSGCNNSQNETPQRDGLMPAVKELGIKGWLAPPQLTFEFQKAIQAFFDEHHKEWSPRKENIVYNQALESFCGYWGARLFPAMHLTGPFGANTRSHLVDASDAHGPPVDLFWHCPENQTRIKELLMAICNVRLAAQRGKWNDFRRNTHRFRGWTGGASSKCEKAPFASNRPNSPSEEALFVSNRSNSPSEEALFVSNRPNSPSEEAPSASNRPNSRSEDSDDERLYCGVTPVPNRTRPSTPSRPTQETGSLDSSPLSSVLSLFPAEEDGCMQTHHRAASEADRSLSSPRKRTLDETTSMVPQSISKRQASGKPFLSSSEEPGSPRPTPFYSTGYVHDSCSDTEDVENTPLHSSQPSELMLLEDGEDEHREETRYAGDEGEGAKDEVEEVDEEEGWEDDEEGWEDEDEEEKHENEEDVGMEVDQVREQGEGPRLPPLTGAVPLRLTSAVEPHNANTNTNSTTQHTTQSIQLTNFTAQHNNEPGQPPISTTQHTTQSNNLTNTTAQYTNEPSQPPNPTITTPTATTAAAATTTTNNDGDDDEPQITSSILTHRRACHTVLELQLLDTPLPPSLAAPDANPSAATDHQLCFLTLENCVFVQDLFRMVAREASLPPDRDITFLNFRLDAVAGGGGAALRIRAGGSGATAGFRVVMRRVARWWDEKERGGNEDLEIPVEVSVGARRSVGSGAGIVAACGELLASMEMAVKVEDEGN